MIGCLCAVMHFDWIRREPEKARERPHMGNLWPPAQVKRRSILVGACCTARSLCGVIPIPWPVDMGA